MLREWIIFAISLGVGGHIALGVVLHAPEAWPWRTAGLSGLLIGLLVYGLVQLARSVWWMVRRRHRQIEVNPPLDF
jgi:hypothetical protein